MIEPINSDNPDNAADGADGTTKMYKGVHFVLLFFSIAFLFMRMFDVDEDLSQPFFFILLGTLWAALEVQIEGEHGWAENLPTSKFLNLHFTWYHVVMNAMVLVIIFQNVKVSWRRPFWTAALFLIEDFLWFIINPYFGILRYNKQKVTWHKWVCGMPLGNWISATIMLTTAMLSLILEESPVLFIYFALITVYLIVMMLIRYFTDKTDMFPESSDKSSYSNLDMSGKPRSTPITF
jgi:hypothetical protein